MDGAFEAGVDIAQLTLSGSQAQRCAPQRQIQAADFIQPARGFVLQALAIGQSDGVPFERRHTLGDARGKQPPGGQRRGQTAEEGHEDDRREALPPPFELGLALTDDLALAEANRFEGIVDGHRQPI